MMRILLIFGLLTFFSVLGFSQKIDMVSTSISSDTTAPDNWQFEGSGYYYIIPNESDEITLLGYADYKSVHLEVRYNYEDKNTASLFGGYRFETGSKLVFGATPIVGYVFGNTNGLAPGLLIDLSYGKFDFYSESEYVFDLNGSENNFYYTWSELAVSPTENFRTGISANRTRLYQTDLDFQRGIFAQYSLGKLTAGIHYFNPFSDDYFLITTISIEF